MTILDDLSFRLVRPDNGVVATCSVTFRDRRRYLHDPGCDVEATWLGFETETVRGILALLRAYSEADASWEAYDGRVPLLLRREGRRVLSQASAEPGHSWDPERSPCLALVDLPYTVEPLGPWADVDTRA